MELREAFALGPGAVVAAVGGGGKTSLVFALAEEEARAGGAAVATTTTKLTRPGWARVDSEFATASERSVEDVPAPQEGAVLLLHAGRGTRARYLGVSGEAVAAMVELGASLIAVEADGSGGRPFKAPAAHEPVIPACVTDVIVCVGLEVLGEPLTASHVHRAERVAALARAGLGEIVTASIIVDVLLAEEGGRKSVPEGARLHALLNGPPADEHLRLGQHIAQRLVYGGFTRAVVATAHERHVHAVVR